MCKQQNITVPQDKDGTLLTHVPGIPSLGHTTTSPLSDESTSGKDASRGLESPPRVQSPLNKEPFSKVDRRISDERLVVQGVDIVELQRLQAILAENPEDCKSMLVEEASQAMEYSGRDDLMSCVVVFQQIDQQLFELGPFAKDAYVDGEGPVQPVSAPFQLDVPSNEPPPPMTGRRTRRGRQPSGGQGRVPKRGSKNIGEAEGPNVPSDDEKSLTEETVVNPEKVKEGPLKEPPRKKWRKVGSGGRQQRRTKERLLEQDSKANVTTASSNTPGSESLSSAPASMNSPSIIPAASELEMQSLYFPSQCELWASSPPDMQPSATSSTAGDSQGVLSPRNLGSDAQSSSSLVSEITEDDNSVRGERTSKRNPATARAGLHVPRVPTCTVAIPTPTLNTVSQPISNHIPDKGTSERMYGLERGQSLEPLRKPSPVRGGTTPEQPTPDPKVQLYGEEALITRFESSVSRSDSMPDPHPISTPPSVSKPPEYSIAHLTGGPELQGSVHPFDGRSIVQPGEQSKTWIQHGERVVRSPSIPGQYRDADSPLLTAFRNRRTSSSSSHRSLKQNSLDDNVITKVTQLPPPRAQSVSVISSAKWGASNVPYMLNQDNRGPGTPEPAGTTTADKVAMVNPYALWANTNQVAAEGTPATNPLPQYPSYPSPFLQANWLQARGGMLSGLQSFHPQMFQLDPSNPYKPSVLGSYLPYRYPFPSGLKPSFPMAAFNPPAGAAANTQPQTPSASGSFAFSQTPLYPLPSNTNIPAFRNLNEASNQSTSATPPIFQPPPFGATKEDKGGGENVHEKIPALSWMQPSILPNFPAYFGTSPFGMQMPLTPNPVSQPPNVNPFAPRLGTSLSNPLTVTSQVENNLTKLERRPVKESTTPKMHQRTPSLATSAVDMMSDPALKRSEASPKPAMEMARFPPSSQRGSQFPFGGDPQHIDQMKWKPLPDSPQLQNSSATPPLIVPPFATMFPAFPATSSAVDARSHMITNAPQLPGHVTLANGRMMPVGYATQPVVGRGRQDSSGGRGSPRSTPEKKKLRIHQVNKDDFKPQAKAVDKRRRRPWRRSSKDKEDEKKDVKGGTPQLNHLKSDPEQSSSPRGSANLALPTTVAGLQAGAESIPGDTYGLNMLAACSVDSRDQGKAAPLTLSSEPQDSSLPTRPQMPSPVSLAGASTLLLLGKDVKLRHPTPETGAVAMVTAKEKSQMESTVVDSLLQLSSSALTGMCPPGGNQHSRSLGRAEETENESLRRAEETENQLIMVQGRETRAASFSAAETMLMISQTPEEEKRGKMVGKQSGTPRDGVSVDHMAEEMEEVFEGRGKPSVIPLQKTRRSGSENAGEVDSEATDTDSEATLSPTSPSWTGMELAGMGLKVPTSAAEPEPAAVESVSEPTRPEEDLTALDSAVQLPPALNSAEQLPPALKGQGSSTQPKSPPQVDDGIRESSEADLLQIPSVKEEECPSCNQEQKLTETAAMLNDALDNPQPFLDGDSVTDRVDGQKEGVSEEEEKNLLDSPSPSPVSTKTQNEETSSVVMETSVDKTTSRTPDEEDMDAHDSDAHPAQVQPECELPCPPQPSSPLPSEVVESSSLELDPKSADLAPELKTMDLELVLKPVEPEPESAELEPELKPLEPETTDPSQQNEEATKTEEELRIAEFEPELKPSESDTTNPSQQNEEATKAEAEEELPLAKRPKLDDDSSPHEDLGESLVPSSAVLSEVPTEALGPQSPLHDAASVEDTAKCHQEIMDDEEHKGELNALAKSQDTSAVPLADPNVLLQPQDSMEVVQKESTPDCDKAVTQMEDTQPSSCSPCGDSELQTSGAGSDNVTDTNTTGSPLPSGDNITDTGSPLPSGDNITDTGSPLPLGAGGDNITDTNRTGSPLPLGAGGDNITDTNTTGSPLPFPDNITDTNTIGSPSPAEDKDVTSPANAGDQSSSQKSPIDKSPAPVEPPLSPSKEQDTTLIGQRLPSWSHFAAAASDTRVSPDPALALSPEHRGSFDEELKAISPPTECGVDPSLITSDDDPVFEKDGADEEKHSSCSPRLQRPEVGDASRVHSGYSEHVSHSTSGISLESDKGEPKSLPPAPIGPQNRLSVDKPVFGRYQRQRRLSAQSLKHAREVKLELDERPGKRRPKPRHERLPRGLFDADPPPVKPPRRDRVLEHEHEWPLGRKRERDDDRHGFRKTKVMSSSKSSSHSYHGASAERTTLANHPPHPRSYPPVDVPLRRHQRGADRGPSQDPSRSHSREPSKPRSRPPSRQSRHTSPVMSSHFHSPTWSNQREFSPLSDDDESPAVRPRPHHEPHKQWSPDCNHHRDRGYAHSRHTAQKRGHQLQGHDSHLGASKNHHASGFEVSRKERRDGGGSHSASPERRKHHFALLDQESQRALEKSVSVGRKRPLHEEGGRSGDLRRKSYESISEDELTFDLPGQEPGSSREDLHSLERKSSCEPGLEQRRGSWGSRMERKRQLSSGESMEGDDRGRRGGIKHHKHKHKKWQEWEVGKEHRTKRGSDDKHRHGHRKY